MEKDETILDNVDADEQNKPINEGFDEIDNQDLETAEEEVVEEKPEPPKPEFQITISKDFLTVYIKVKTFSIDQIVSKQEILEFLQQNSISYGVCEENIDDFCENRKYYMELVAAKGVAPVHGKDGYIEKKFNSSNHFTPLEHEDGTVDYKELGIVQNVKKGEVLCVLVAPEPGVDGIDVFGSPISFEKGKTADFPAGNHTTLSEDGTLLLSEIDGCIDASNSVTVSVNEIYTIKGDVDASTGNIDFLGTVKVLGDVREGFRLKAGKDIVVKGMVEGALLEAGENIVISNGINGMGKGNIVAKGNVVSAYIENANISCDGDVLANVIMHSDIKAGGSVILRGIKGALIGGTCEVGKLICANTIGTDRFLQTNIIIKSSELNKYLLGENGIHELNEYTTNVEFLSEEVTKVSYFISDMTKRLGDLGEPEDAMLRSLILKKNRLKMKLAENEKKLEELKAEQDKMQEYKIMGFKTIYPGTKILIGCHFKPVDDVYNLTKFYPSQSGIISAPLSHSEKM